MRFTRAIVRPPTANFAAGLSSAGQGPPDFALALKQHSAYAAALRQCGLQVTTLAPDAAHPDATFVEDTAIVTERGAILTRPGAPSRTGEIDGISEPLRRFYGSLAEISAPGTVDGGDICEADGHFLIGISARTNDAGASQLAEHLRSLKYTSSTLDIRATPGLLHLKSGIAYLGDGVWAADGAIRGALRGHGAIRARDLIAVPAKEAYAANCVRVNDSVLVAAGYPHMVAALNGRGLHVVQLEMSEFRKMDGGLSCLSLRF